MAAITIYNQIIRVILVILYILIGISTLLGSLYLIWISIYGIGWSGGKTTILEVVWQWKGGLLFSIYAFVASAGILKKSKIGTLFGYPILIGILIYFIFNFIDYSLQIEKQMAVVEIFWALLFLVLPVLMLIGLTKQQKSLAKFSVLNYVSSIILFVLLVLSCSFLFI